MIKKSFFIFFLSFFLFFDTHSTRLLRAKERTKEVLFVVIDPGHGGIDRGASNSWLNEATINLGVSLYLFNILKKDPAFKVSLTRNKDQFLSLNQRAKIANQKEADVLISIHVNASNDKRVKGAEIYFQNDLSLEEKLIYLAKSEKNGKELAEKIIKKTPFSYLTDLNPQVLSILNDLSRNYRLFQSALLAQSLAKNWGSPSKKKLIHGWLPIRQAPFFVISQVNMPSVLIELGYITHKKEAYNLSRKAFQREQAQKIYQGLLSYKKEIDKTHP